MADLTAYYLGGGGKGTTRISGSSIEDIQKQASQSGINPANLYGEGFRPITPDVLSGSSWLRQMTGQATNISQPTMAPSLASPTMAAPIIDMSKSPTPTATNTLKAYDVNTNSVVYVEPGKYVPGVSLTPPSSSQSWVSPTTGQATPAGVGMPKPITPIGTQISNEQELQAKRQELAKLGIPQSEWGDYISSPDAQGRLYYNQPATLVSPTGVKEKVATGSTKANNLLNSGWSLSGQVNDNKINAGLLTPKTEISIGQDVTPTSYLADTAKASANTISKTIDEQIKKYQELLTPPETDLSKQVSKLLGEFDTESLTGRGAAQLAEEERRGIEEKTNALTAKNTELKTKVAEIDALTASYNLANQQAESVPMTLSRLQGQQAQNYKMYIAQKNLLASEASFLQAQLSGMQGELQSAQNAADRAVTLEYQDRESAYNAKIAQLNILQPQLEKEEKTYASAVQLYLQQQADALVEQKNEKKQILDVMLKGISAGVDIATVDQIGRSANYQEALNLLSQGTQALPKEMTAIEEYEAKKKIDLLYKPATKISGGIAGDITPSEEITLEGLSPLAKAVYDGTIKLSDITPTQRAEIAPELNAIGYSSSITGEVKQDIDTIVSGMDNVMNSWKQIPNRYKGKLQGRLSSLFKLEENIPEIANFKAASSIIGMQLTRLFEKGRISDQDRIFYLNLMPNINQNEKSAQAGAEELKKRLQAKSTSILEKVMTEEGGSTSKSLTEEDPMGIR